VPKVGPTEEIPMNTYQASEQPDDPSPVIPALSAVPVDLPGAVDKLRQSAKDASKLMVNLTAKQCMVLGNQKPVCHQVFDIKDEEIFRRVRKNGTLSKPTNHLRAPKHAVGPPSPESEWLYELEEIADRDNPWIFQGQVEGQAGRQYLFTYRADAKDERCEWEESPIRAKAFDGPVDCFEQVLTDKDFKVVSVSREMLPPDPCKTQLIQTTLYYDWVKLEGIESPVLLPARERMMAIIQGEKSARYESVTWAGYEKFRVDHKISAEVR